MEGLGPLVDGIGASDGNSNLFSAPRRYDMMRIIRRREGGGGEEHESSSFIHNARAFMWPDYLQVTSGFWNVNKIESTGRILVWARGIGSRTKHGSADALIECDCSLGSANGQTENS